MRGSKVGAEAGGEWHVKVRMGVTDCHALFLWASFEVRSSQETERYIGQFGDILKAVLFQVICLYNCSRDRMAIVQGKEV